MRLANRHPARCARLALRARNAAPTSPEVDAMATNNPALNDLGDEAARLADEAQSKVDRLSSSAREAVGRVSEKARDTVDRVSDRASDLAGQVSEQSDRLLADARDYVSNHPIGTLVAAAAAGYLIGRMMR
jgi:ElaB/YqjD/DUF883 family membrane-anchored ribosome-binding protein